LEVKSTLPPSTPLDRLSCEPLGGDMVAPKFTIKGFWLGKSLGQAYPRQHKMDCPGGAMTLRAVK